MPVITSGSKLHCLLILRKTAAQGSKPSENPIFLTAPLVQHIAHTHTLFRPPPLGPCSVSGGGRGDLLSLTATLSLPMGIKGGSKGECTGVPSLGPLGIISQHAIQHRCNPEFSSQLRACALKHTCCPVAGAYAPVHAGWPIRGYMNHAIHPGIIALRCSNSLRHALHLSCLLPVTAVIKLLRNRNS